MKLLVIITVNNCQHPVICYKFGFTDLPEDLCKLYCKVADSSSYYLLKEKVIDGTKCDQNSFDICVNGICRKGGCDNYLDSNTTLGEYQK